MGQWDNGTMGQWDIGSKGNLNKASSKFAAERYLVEYI
jgi:hypothetical protein